LLFGFVLQQLLKIMGKHEEADQLKKRLSRPLDMEYFKHFDIDGEDGVSRLEFLVGMMVNLKMVKIEDVKMVLMQFDHHDADGSGHLDENDLQAIMGKAGKLLNAAAPAGAPATNLMRGSQQRTRLSVTKPGDDFALDLQVAMDTGGFACVPALIKLYFFIAFGLVWLLVDAIVALCVVAIVASINPDREVARSIRQMHAANFIAAVSIATSSWTAIWASIYAHLDSNQRPGNQFTRDFFYFFEGVHQQAIVSTGAVKLDTWSTTFVGLAAMSIVQVYLIAVFGYRCAIAMARERERDRSGSPRTKSPTEVSMKDLIAKTSPADTGKQMKKFARAATQNLGDCAHSIVSRGWDNHAST